MPPEEDEAIFRRNLSLTRRRSLRNSRDRGMDFASNWCKERRPRTVKQLLDEGMDVSVITFGPKSKGVTPVHLASGAVI